MEYLEVEEGSQQYVRAHKDICKGEMSMSPTSTNEVCDMNSINIQHPLIQLTPQQ